MLARSILVSAVVFCMSSNAFAQLNSYEQGRRQLGDDFMQQHENWEKRRNSSPSGNQRPNAAPARVLYGAIAMSKSSGAIGWAHGHSSLRDAEKFAEAQCSAHATDCERVLSFGNGCGTLAMGVANYTRAVANAATQRQAEQQAVSECNRQSRDCRPVRTVCTK
jgi:Domain of unknown function (DUF4189)